MEFNVEKCKVMHIGMNRNYRYHMDQKELEVVEEERTLIGVLITNDLKASQQCTVYSL